MLILAVVVMSLSAPQVWAGDFKKPSPFRKPKTKPSAMAGCNDGLACTDDRIVNGTCTHVIRPGFCLIDGVCYTRHQKNPENDCQECLDQWGQAYQRRWGYDNSNACSDGNNCTEGDHCSSGSCVGRQIPGCN